VAGHPITFEAAQGERIVISGKRLLTPFGADLVSRRHIVIRGFFFEQQAQRLVGDVASGQALIVDASNILIERCVFDGRMNYLFSAFIHESRNIILRNNIFINHWSPVRCADNDGTLAIRGNTFLCRSMAKIYAVRNKRVVVRGNLFAENLYPKKKLQYKVQLGLNESVDLDYNCYHFDPKNDERRVVDYFPMDVDASRITSLPERGSERKRVGVKGSLDAWRRLGHGRRSMIADPKWKDPKLIARLRRHKRGWPNRHWNYPPFSRSDVGLRPASPCLGKGEGGKDMGADYSY